MQPNNNSELQDIAVADPSSSAPSSASAGLSSWPELKQLNAAVTITPLDSDAQLRNRKRQRPSAPSSPSASFSTPGDLKLDFAGFEVGNNAPYPPAVSTDDVLTFLKNLQLAQDQAALALATQRLAQDGFDSVLALAFAVVSELQHAGIADAQLVWQQAHRDFQARRFQVPGVLSPNYTVSRWMELCGIPKVNIFEYTEYLCRLGYSAVRDLDTAPTAPTCTLPDRRAHCFNRWTSSARTSSTCRPTTASWRR
ncbi:uncharacterized protein PITG_19822 [Phytophthora infestans T30-4]|uniref:Uncharacterized protein n=1 Tax=Phytophthora infestans (strain T30-4) TaxID=403677 RepID=D0P1D6_PHYIT|nr:uncharacterized protein PITG_19822 [Phytophthora infestans T30-4]EEY54169.1 conserved hypothetical protein [Phytophthora infestans T30-4]|eukprot:XP_002895883.1 conserved hypothetical protein [Phytophthora infestans T30-4]